jgi:AcrR family transcriptional regulator
MSVKPSSHRARQAQATRQAVTAAARGLFAERGYTATTIEAISDASGIPAQTIYSAFGAKRAILEAIRVAWIEEAEVATSFEQALTMPRLADRLRASAHWTRRQFELGHDVIATYQEAARADPEAARVWTAALAGRAVGIRRMIGGASRDLRPGLTRRRAVDTFVAMTLAEAYRTLVLERGWTADEFEEWLARTLVRELVGGDGGG